MVLLSHAFHHSNHFYSIFFKLINNTIPQIIFKKIMVIRDTNSFISSNIKILINLMSEQLNFALNKKFMFTKTKKNSQSH